MEIIRKIPDRDKYEVWYEELFSDNKQRNIICCQADNIIYGKHVYQKTSKFFRCLLSVSFVIIFSIMIGFALLNRTGEAILLLISVYGMFSIFIDKAKDASDVADINESIVNILKEEHEL